MITAKEFRAWQAALDVEGRPIRGIELAKRLGYAPETISRMRHQGVSDETEKLMRWAMAAMSAGLQPWGAS